MFRNPFVLAVGLLGLAGCATMSVEERTAFCTGTDWYRYGANDGRLGIPSSERADVISDCAEIGHPIDAAAYQAGRAEGLREYCTVENGYEVGYSGRRYQQVCPPGLDSDFLQGYAKGRDDRPSYAIYPGLGIGIGSGGVSTGVGIGIGVGGFYDDCYYRDPFPCGWRRPWGYPWPYYRHPSYRHPYYPQKYPRHRDHGHADRHSSHPAGPPPAPPGPPAQAAQPAPWPDRPPPASARPDHAGRFATRMEMKTPHQSSQR